VTIWALNAVRLSLLVSIGAHVSPTLALQGFHSQAGWIFFLLVTVSLMVIAHRTPALRAGAQATNATLDPAIGLAAALLIPFAALMAGRILGAAFGPGPHWAGVLAIALPATALVLFRRDIGKRLSAIGFEPILLGVAVGGFWIATQAPSADGHALGRWLEAQPPLAAGAWLVLRAIGFVLIVPIAEELAFRGYLHRALIGKYFEKVSPHAFSVLAFVGTSVLFGALHQRWLSGTIAGAVFALALYRSRSLAGPIAAHIAANAVIACYAIIAEHWEFL
jgi:exosortase E/protease (VPEID-CTERM system)